jgi:hypothetical protein
MSRVHTHALNVLPLEKHDQRVNDSLTGVAIRGIAQYVRGLKKRDGRDAKRDTGVNELSSALGQIGHVVGQLPDNDAGVQDA